MNFRLRGLLCLIPAAAVFAAVPGMSQNLQAVSSPPSITSAVSLSPGKPKEPSQLPLAAIQGTHLVPGAFPALPPKPTLPKVFAPSQPREALTRYPWKLDIVTTVFWIGELPTPGNPVPNTVSAWDKRWTSNYGGYDNPDPETRDGFLPKEFTPGQNPFYFALPYNDIGKSGTKASAQAIPWYDEAFYRNGRTILKGRWIAIRMGGKVCYAQWEDVGPFETDDWDYVFGNARPKTRGNKGAGLDVSPAVRDYLEFGTGFGFVDWRFVDVDEVPDGPWKQHGANNPFANSSLDGDAMMTASEGILRVGELRDRLMASLDDPANEGGE